MKKIILHILLLLGLSHALYAQVSDTNRVRSNRDTIPPMPSDEFPVLSDTVQYNDTSIVQKGNVTDTVIKKKVHSPRKATLRSLMIPGWGQIYNKKYWKLPLVYGAIGFPAYLFFYNKQWYNRTKYALSIVANNRYDTPDAIDSLDAVHPQLMSFVTRKDQGSLVDYRNEFRRDMDYAILFTILMYGLNIVDATVDAHLKGFDVSDELTLKVKPSMPAGGGIAGISLVLTFK